jgi:PAS domain S-box-containing protein
MRAELERLRRLLEINQVGTWELLLPEGLVWLNGAGAEMVGDPQADWAPADLRRWYARVHPADRHYLRSQMASFLGSSLPYFYAEIRFRQASGHYSWLRLSGENINAPKTAGALRIAGTFLIVERHPGVVPAKGQEGHADLFQEDPLPRYIFDRETLSILEVSQKAVELYGYTYQEWLQMDLTDFRRPADIEKLEQSLQALPTDEKVKNMGVVRHLKKNGEWLYLEKYVRCVSYRNRAAVLCSLVDVTHRYFLGELDRIESRLSRSLMEDPLGEQQALAQYLSQLEALLPGSRCSLVKVKEGKLQTWCAPSLPEAYNQAINGVPVGPEKGSCGRAAWLNKRVISEDLRKAPEWQDYQDITEAHGLRACWSQPILDHQGEVRASLAFYRDTPGRPGALEMELMERQADFMRVMRQYLETEKQLRHWNERANYVNRATRDVIYDYDLLSDILQVGPQFTEIFGHPVEEGKFLKERRSSLLHPEDKERVGHSFLRFLNEGKGEHWQEAYRLKRPDGRYAYVQEKAYAVRDKQGQARRIIGALADISQEREEQAHLKLLESVVTHTNDAVLITEGAPLEAPGPVVVYANEAFERMTGYSRQDIVGQSPRLLQGPLSDQKELQKLSHHLHAGEPYETCLINYRKDGTPFWIDMRISPVWDQEDRLTHFIAIERDVTEVQETLFRKERQAELATRVDEASTVKEASEAILAYHLQKAGIEWGQFWRVAQNRKQLKLVTQQSKAGTLVMPQEDTAGLAYKQSIAGKAWAGEKAILSSNPADAEDLPGLSEKNGAPPAYLGAFPLPHQEKVIGVLILGGSAAPEDFAYEARRLEALQVFLGDRLHQKRLEENVLKIYHTAPNLICQADLEGNILNANARSEKMLGLSPEELQGRSCYHLVVEKERPLFQEAFWQPLCQGKELRRFQTEATNAKSDRLYLEWSGQAVPEEGLVYLVIQDVTEKRLIQRLLDTATNLAQIGGWDYDIPRKQMEWTSMTRQIYEVSEDYQPVLEDFYRFLRPDFVDWVEQRLQAAIKKGAAVDMEVPILTATNQEKWVRLQGSPLLTHGVPYRLSGAIQDIHDRKVAQIELRQSHYRFEQVAKATSDAIWDWDMLKDQLHLGLGFQKIFGYPSRQVPFTREGWRQNVHPEDASELETKLRSVLEDPNSDFWEAEYRYKRHDGFYAVVVDRGKVLRDIHGEPIRMVGAMTDLTEYYEHLQAIEDQNRRLREIAQTQSHQVRGPLASIMGLVQLVEQGLIEAGQERAVLEQVAQAAHRLDEVVRHIVARTEQEDKQQSP